MVALGITVCFHRHQLQGSVQIAKADELFVSKKHFVDSLSKLVKVFPTIVLCSLDRLPYYLCILLCAGPTEKLSSEMFLYIASVVFLEHFVEPVLSSFLIAFAHLPSKIQTAYSYGVLVAVECAGICVMSWFVFKRHLDTSRMVNLGLLCVMAIAHFLHRMDNFVSSLRKWNGWTLLSVANQVLAVVSFYTSRNLMVVNFQNSGFLITMLSVSQVLFVLVGSVVKQRQSASDQKASAVDRAKTF